MLGLTLALHRPASETPKSHRIDSTNSTVHTIANAQAALQASADWAQSQGVQVQVLSDRLEGEVRDLGRAHAQFAIELATAIANEKSQRPCIFLSGGETTVTLRGNGRGGLNTEYLLSLCKNLNSNPKIYGLAADTNGRDGSEQNAGAWCTPDSLQRAARLSIQPSDCLANNDAYTFFAALDALLVTGSTDNNVNDFRAVLVL